MARKIYNRNVFINCPIDAAYKRLFHAAVFAVLRCDFYPRCASEEEDSGELRLTKILRMIGECRHGIHDLSRTQVDKRFGLPRFNMPFELGIFLGAKFYGDGDHARKVCLIFERQPYSYDKFISDIKGQDIAAHRNDPEVVIRKIRNWLAANSSKWLPGGQSLCVEFRRFERWMPGKCLVERLRMKDLTFGDYWNLVRAWIDLQKETNKHR